MLVTPRKMHSIWDSAHIVALEFAPDVLEGLKDRLLFQCLRLVRCLKDSNKKVVHSEPWSSLSPTGPLP